MNIETKKKRIILTIIYAAVIVYLSFMDVATGQLDEWNLDSVKSTLGVVIAVVILSCYKFKDFLKWQYYAWLAFSTVTCIVLYMCKFHIDDNRKRWLFFALGFIVYGLILLREILGIIETKKLGIGKTYILWVYMLFWMMISRYEVIWPVTFCIIFSAFYLCDMDKERHEIWLDGVSYGLMASYVVLQLFADLFRPFDSDRYRGIYENSNMTALFYCLVLVGFLYRLWLITGKKDIKWAAARKMALIVGIGWVVAHSYMTCSRTGAIIVILLVLIYGFCAIWKLEKGKGKFLKPIGFVAIVMALSFAFFPLSYMVARYGVAITHQRVVFPVDNLEYLVDPKTEPIDSERYTSLDELIDNSILRYFDKFRGNDEEQEQVQIEHYVNVVYAAETEDIPLPKGASADNALMEGWGQGVDSTTYRLVMWEYYISKLNMMGHTALEVPVWVHVLYLAPHTQNILIQMAYCYGTPVGIIWLIMMISMFVSSLVKLIKGDADDKNTGFIMLLFIVAYGLFGMTEITWNVGQLGFSLFFLFLRDVFALKEPKSLVKKKCEQRAI